jgi:ABC-type branched-subunit amino acid transport system ATPase component
LVRTFQHVAIFSELTIRESVQRANLCRNAMGKKEAQPPKSFDDVTELLEICDLMKFAERRVAELAYGTQKLVNVAMALATAPTLLLLDEPAAGLSAAEAGDLGVVLAAVSDQGMTICLVDHNMPFLSSLCERVVVLDAGSVLFEGTPQEVRENEEVRRVYLGGR